MSQPIKDRSNEANILIAHFSQLAKGALVSYDEIVKLIGWDIRANRGPMMTAIRRLKLDHGRVVVGVCNEGYRVMTDDDIAQRRMQQNLRRRRNNARMSKVEAGTVDISSLNPQDRQALFGQIAIAHVHAETASAKAVKKITASCVDTTQPLALNNALEALKKNLH
jgi:phosphoribosylformylglycinamidine (FGAM) synthase-like amidotransferase family enzyme